VNARITEGTNKQQHSQANEVMENKTGLIPWNQPWCLFKKKTLASMEMSEPNGHLRATGAD
jgi:hypothetical protein